MADTVRTDMAALVAYNIDQVKRSSEWKEQIVQVIRKMQKMESAVDPEKTVRGLSINRSRKRCRASNVHSHRLALARTLRKKEKLPMETARTTGKLYRRRMESRHSFHGSSRAV